MKAGFIGAGKVGFSLGKYFAINGVTVSGYYSRTPSSAAEAAAFVGCENYRDLISIVENSDILFVTVPDREIVKVWEELCNLPIKNKIICHCSGYLSSAAFFNGIDYGAYPCSLHPLCPVSDKYLSCKALESTCFTVEGCEAGLEQLQQLMAPLGNKVIPISTENKALYHAAAVMVSNHMVALAHIGAEMLQRCGFDREDGEMALAPLILENAKAIAQRGVVEALTGPVERNDLPTVQAHRSVMGAEKEIYDALALTLIDVAQLKHPGRNYEELRRELEQFKEKRS